MINNIEKIKKLLVFESTDDFYHLQILKRKKEHPDLGSKSYVVKTYYISSIEYLDKEFEEIKNLCNFHNARAYINLNRRSFEKTAFQLLRKVTDQILNKDYKSARKAYESVCGSFSNESETKWIIDIDEPNFNFTLLEENLREVMPIGEDKIYAKIPTKNGCHVITKPFNIRDFKYFYPNLDIHKNNPTVAFVP